MFELFFLHRYLKLVCIDKLVDHPYFIRSKGHTDSFPIQCSDKGKAMMGDNNEEINLTDIVVAPLTIIEQNELAHHRRAK